MGKIRIKTIGDEELEIEEKKKAEEKKLQKKAREEATELKSSEEISESNSDNTETTSETASENKQEKANKEKSNKPEQQSFRSKAYENLSSKIEKSKVYSLNDGLELLEKVQRGKFDETVELHINTTASGVSGNVTLPHGTGKKTRVAIASDALIAEIEKGIISFDILVAEPQLMPKLARVAKILGPKGLMPNPKNGTISANPADVVKKYEGGQVNFKTEAKNPLLHLTVGKMSFGTKKLSENIEELIRAVKKANIVNVTLKSTMSPGIKIKV